MIIAAFDLATRTGIAVGDAYQDPKCWSESLGMSGEPHHARFAACMTLTDSIIRDYDVDLIAIERPITGLKEQSSIPLLLIGLRACVFGVAKIRGIPAMEVDVRTVRSSFLGKGLGTLPGKEAKQRVMEGCRLRGWEVEDDNAADAAAVWDYTRAARRFNSTTDLEAWANRESQKNSE